jgi:hypothetical protein
MQRMRVHEARAGHTSAHACVQVLVRVVMASRAHLRQKGSQWGGRVGVEASLDEEGAAREEELDGVLESVHAATRHLHNRLACTAS